MLLGVQIYDVLHKVNFPFNLNGLLLDLVRVVLVLLLYDGLTAHHHVVRGLLIECGGNALTSVLDVHIGVKLLLFIDLLAYILQLLDQGFLCLLKCP